jgi:MYXO-CTERM domain-containing protein
MHFDLASSVRFLSLFGGALALAVPLLTSTPAEACGGTFCDNGPTTMPVDQTGENILFHLTDTTVEAHIQIQYDPDSGADAFAWVIPVMAIPEFEVGSQFLFDAMLAGSVPSYGLSVQTDSCGNDEAAGTGPLSGTGDGGDEGDPSNNDTGEMDPEVVLQTTVGAFEIAVLEGGTVEGVMQWLGDNGYQQDPAAEPILAQYLAEDFLFVALKLSNRAGVDEIHPIVIRYEGDEPCVPIRLTAIAAVDDMEIRTFFLQDARVVPVNYRHVLVNPLKLDWLNNASNYKEVISMAVDAQEADGNAFVTEYAGPSSVIQTFNINPGWSSAPFAGFIDSPIGVIEELELQSLLSCDPEWGTECNFIHPLIAPILEEYIPVPDGLEANEFYDCLSCFAPQINLAAWNAAGFVQKLDERIINPAVNAVALVEQNPYLTRLYTTISPLEMNADPIFKVNASLPEVPAIRLAAQTNHCDGSASVVLPDGREVYFPDSSSMSWPDFGDEMPWEEDIDQEAMADDAPLVNLVDNTAKIDELLAGHNTRSKAIAYGLGGGNGCACSVGDEGRSGVALGLAMLALLGLVRRRNTRGSR